MRQLVGGVDFGSSVVRGDVEEESVKFLRKLQQVEEAS